MPANLFKQFPHIDLFSFIAGLVLGAILYIVFVRLLKLFKQIRATRLKTKEKTQTVSKVKLIDRYKLDLLKRAQSDHLLGPLFPLSEIFVSVPLIYPYPYIDPKSKIQDSIEASSLLPFVSDTPEFYETIPFRSKSLLSAIMDHRLLLIQGQIGAGKTTIINNAISTILENKMPSSVLIGSTPIYAHYSEIDLTSAVRDDPLQVLYEISQFRALNTSKSGLESTFLPLISEGNAILFLDGLDEAVPSFISEFTLWLESLIKSFPLLKIVLAVNPVFIDGLSRIGFVSYLISPVNLGIRRELHNKLTFALRKLQLFSPPSTTVVPISEDSWIRQNEGYTDLFTLTLSLVADLSLSGTAQGRSLLLRSFIDRFCSDTSQNERLSRIARLIYENPLHLINKSDLNKVLEESDQIPESPDFQFQKESYVQFLINTGFLIERQHDFLAIKFSPIFSFLLSRDTEFKPSIDWESNYLNPVANMALAFSDETSYLLDWLKQKDFPLLRNIGLLGLHFEKVRKNQILMKNIIPLLISSLQQDNPNLSKELKYLSITLKLSPDTVNQVLDFLAAKSKSGKLFAILGFGFINSTKSISFLKQVLDSSSPLEKAYCAISLLRIGSTESRKVLLDSLFKGDDFYRRLVCEMLSTDQVDGLPILKELSTSTNISIRKSSIFGMKLINEPWVVDFLTTISTKDSEWIVRDTAAAALEEIANHQIELNNYTPPTPDKLDWLVEIAGKKGQGIAAKSIPNDLLMDLSMTGNSQEKLASLYILSRYPNQEVIDFVVTLFEKDSDLGDQAFFYSSEISMQEPIN